MRKYMKTSVAIATYNSMKYLELQLQSILEQTVPVDEVILFDDASSDNTVSFLKQFIERNALQHWHLFQHESNEGYIQTFTDTFSKCTNDIVILCDHDDIWEKDKVENIKNAFEAHSDMLALATKFKPIDEKGMDIPTKQRRNRTNNNIIRRRLTPNGLSKLHFKDIAIYNVSPGCTCAVKKELIDEYLIFKECKNLPHDWKLMTIAAALDGLYYLDVITTDYRLHDSNTIGLGHVNALEERTHVVEKNYFEKKDLAEIASFYQNRNHVDTNYMNNVLSLFQNRKKALEKKDKLLAIKNIVSSLPMNGLYESTIYDFLTILKGDKQ